MKRENVYVYVFSVVTGLNVATILLGIYYIVLFFLHFDTVVPFTVCVVSWLSLSLVGLWLYNRFKKRGVI